MLRILPPEWVRFLAKGSHGLGARIRWFEPGIVYEVTARTVDRTFLFRPSHRKESPLLRYDSPPSSLSPDSPIIPKPSIINIVGSSIGRALQRNPINIHCYESNINHPHGLFSPIEDNLQNIPKFFQQTNSLIARGVNDTWSREGAVFTRARVTPCKSDAAAEKQLLYAVTNPVKDGLISRVKETPFFSTYMHQSQGEPLRFWYIDWAAYWKAGGADNKKRSPKEFLKWVEWETTPLPHLADLTVHQRQTRIRKLVQEEERHQEELRREEKRTVIGVPALFKIDPRNRPKNPKPNTPQPLCHADDRETALAFEEEWDEFLDAYRAASIDYRGGYFERLFPAGSFRPPLIRIINGDGT